MFMEEKYSGLPFAIWFVADLINHRFEDRSFSALKAIFKGFDAKYANICVCDYDYDYIDIELTEEQYKHSKNRHIIQSIVQQLNEQTTDVRFRVLQEVGY